MKIGVFIEDFSPEVGGGFTIQGDIFRSLLELAGESPHEFIVICREPSNFSEALRSTSIKAVAFPGTLPQRLVSKAARSIASFEGRRKEQTRLDQLAQACGLEFMWFVGAEGVQTDTPYCAIVWDLQHRLQPWFPEVTAHGVWDHREDFYSKFLRRAAVIIAGTEAGREEIERFYSVPRERIRILPHPTPRFALENRDTDGAGMLAKFNLAPGYVFYPAQFWPHKNHANLLLALSRLRENYGIDMHAVFVGSDKGNLTYIRELTDRLGLSNQVHLLGFVEQGELAALYRNALALTYVSHFGPENLPPLEAFALGCPVIAARVPGSCEQLGNAAILVEPTEVEEITDAIRRLYEDADLIQTLVARGRERANSRTGSHFVRGAFSIFDQFEKVRRCWAADFIT